MFKEKNTKKRIIVPEFAKDNSTLDAKHNNMINTITCKYNQIDELKQQHANVSSEIAKIGNIIREHKTNGTTDNPEYDIAWSSNIMLQDQRRQIESNITSCMSSQEEIEYYENTGYILFKYYDLLDKETDSANEAITTCTKVAPPPMRYTKSRKKQPPPPSITILDALNNVNAIPNKSEETNEEGETAAPAIQNAPDVNPVQDKSTLVDEYLALVDSSYIRNTPQGALGTCPKCNTCLECIQHEGAMVCVDCGYQELLLVEQNRPILRQPNKDASHFSYKRINHFREWCSQVQGKESTDIPDEVFEQILQEIRKEKITDTKKISYSKMREILKKLKINRYYEHINYIINRINGVPTPHFSPELEDKLCNMFKEIQGPFLRHCPSSRKNFLSYSFCLNKMVQLLGLDEYLPFFSLLKSREKLYIQDQIWKKICADLGWPAYPSL